MIPVGRRPLRRGPTLERPARENRRPEPATRAARGRLRELPSAQHPVSESGRRRVGSRLCCLKALWRGAPSIHLTDSWPSLGDGELVPTGQRRHTALL